MAVPIPSKRLEEISWERAVCHLCGAEEGFEPVRLGGEPLTSGQFGYRVHPVVCRCGLVFLNPRWTPRTYNLFYTEHYDELYRLEIKPDYGVKGVIDNMAVVWSRSGPCLPNSPGRILDVGCGSGYGLKFLAEQNPGAEIHGIEASPECVRILVDEVGANLIDVDVDGPWAERYEGFFDFIVMRHVMEHFLDPVSSLGRVRRALKPGGLLYIAVPDMLNPRTELRDYDRWWEYHFRAVHPYYYCRDTALATLALAGLEPVAEGEENEEYWCVLRPGRPSAPRLDRVREKQMAVLTEKLPGPGLFKPTKEERWPNRPQCC